MGTLIDAALKNRAVTIVFSLLFLVFGFSRLPGIPVDVLPDLNAPTVSILTEAHGMGPEDVEKLVSFPLESALQGAAGLRRIRSASATGISMIQAEFGWDVDPWLARQMIMERLQLAREQLPEGVDTPIMAPPSSIMGEILFLGLTTTSPEGLIEARTFADARLRPRLLGVDGVAQVTVIGSGRQVVRITPRMEVMAEYRVAASELEEVLANLDGTASGGWLENGPQSFLVRSMGRANRLDQIRNLPLGRDGLKLSDVADVGWSTSQPIGKASVMGHGSVVLSVARQPGSNTLEVTRALDQVLENIRQELPAGVELHTDLFRQQNFIEHAMKSLGKAFLEGGFLVILIVILFLGSIRASVICLLALPISLIGATLILEWMGSGINTMTLGGLTIAMGALVDDAIVFVENAVRHLRSFRGEGHARFEVIRASLRQILGSIVYATLIIVVVFLPMFFLSGVEGKLFRPLGLSYVLALVVSLFTAMLIVPAWVFWLNPGGGESESFLSRMLKKIYQPMLDWVLQNSVYTVFMGFCLSVMAVPWLMSFGTTFLPPFREGALTIEVSTLPGTSLSEASRLGREAEKALDDLPGVLKVSRRTGRAEQDAHAVDPGMSEIEVVLDLEKGTQDVLINRIRHRLEDIAGLNFNVGQPISHRIDHILSGARSAIVIKIFGENLAEIQAWAMRARAELSELSSLADLSVEQQSEQPELRFVPRFERLAEFGISPKELALQTEMLFGGAEVSEILSDTLRIPVLLRYETSGYQREDWKQFPVYTSEGEELVLGDVMDIRYHRAPNRIGRENRERRILIQANLQGKDLGGAARAVEETLAGMDWPPGIRYEVGGQFEAQRSASLKIATFSLVSLMVVWLLLNLVLKSTSLGFLTLLTLPLSLIGGALAVSLTGKILSLSSLVGFITLFGIATRNGIILMERYHELRQEGQNLRDSVIQGSRERLLPILMTAMSTALGLVPLVMNRDAPGNELQAPMAAVILGGLLSSTLLTLLILPPLYEMWAHRRGDLAKEVMQG